MPDAQVHNSNEHIYLNNFYLELYRKYMWSSLSFINLVFVSVILIQFNVLWMNVTLKFGSCHEHELNFNKVVIGYMFLVSLDRKSNCSSIFFHLTKSFYHSCLRTISRQHPGQVANLSAAAVLTQNTSLTVTPMVNWESPINLMPYVSLYCGRKLERNCHGWRGRPCGGEVRTQMQTLT